MKHKDPTTAIVESLLECPDQWEFIEGRSWRAIKARGYDLVLQMWHSTFNDEEEDYEGVCIEAPCWARLYKFTDEQQKMICRLLNTMRREEQTKIKQTLKRRLVDEIPVPIPPKPKPPAPTAVPAAKLPLRTAATTPAEPSYEALPVLLGMLLGAVLLFGLIAFQPTDEAPAKEISSVANQIHDSLVNHPEKWKIWRCNDTIWFFDHGRSGYDNHLQLILKLDDWPREADVSISDPEWASTHNFSADEQKLLTAVLKPMVDKQIAEYQQSIKTKMAKVLGQ